MTNEEKALAIRDGCLSYLRSRYGSGDLTWHPLFRAVLELFADLLK